MVTDISDNVNINVSITHMDNIDILKYIKQKYWNLDLKKSNQNIKLCNKIKKSPLNLTLEGLP